MNDEFRLLQLEETIKQIQKTLNPQKSEILQLQQKLSALDEFITSNPRVDLISDTIERLNSQLKIQERLSAIESQHSRFSTHYDEILNRHSVYILQIQPWINEMHGILEEAKANRELSNQMKISFKEISSKYKEYTVLLLQNDRMTQNFRTKLDSFETQLASKIDHQEVTKVQDLMRRDFVTCIELEDFKTQISQKFERLSQDMATKTQLNVILDNIQYIKDRQTQVLSELVDKKIEELASDKLRSYATKNDQRVFEDRNSQISKILSDKILMIQKETIEEHKLMQEQIKEYTQQLNEFKSQIQYINQSFQKVVLKDELQIAMQKTLRLQRESEYLNEKLESMSAELFEQKVSFQQFNKQKNLEIQTLQNQLVQKDGESVTYNESPRRVEITQEDVFSMQSSPKKLMKKSMLVQREGSLLNSDMMQRIFQRSDARIQELQTSIDELRQRLPKSSKFQEQQTQSPPNETVNIRMEYFNTMITALSEENKKIKEQLETTDDQIKLLINKPQIKEEVIQDINDKMKFISELEFKLEQKCDSSLVIPILDSKASATEFQETKILTKQLKQCVFDSINSLRTYFTSDQSDQIRDLFLNQLGRYLTYFVKQNETIVQSDNQNINNSKIMQPKYNQRVKSYSSCSKRRDTNEEIRGRAVNRTITDSAGVYNSLKSSPLAFKVMNYNKKSVAIIKRIKV